MNIFLITFFTHPYSPTNNTIVSTKIQNRNEKGRIISCYSDSPVEGDDFSFIKQNLVARGGNAKLDTIVFNYNKVYLQVV